MQDILPALSGTRTVEGVNHPNLLSWCRKKLLLSATWLSSCSGIDVSHAALPLQCLISHISQLATIVPPTNNTKQNAPNRIIILGSDRIVIPKTIDVKSEKSSTAPKCEIITMPSFPSPGSVRPQQQ
jgi:hypothetical protein